MALIIYHNVTPHFNCISRVLGVTRFLSYRINEVTFPYPLNIPSKQLQHLLIDLQSFSFLHLLIDFKPTKQETRLQIPKVAGTKLLTKMEKVLPKSNQLWENGCKWCIGFRIRHHSDASNGLDEAKKSEMAAELIRVEARKDGNLSSVDMEEGIRLTLPRANRLVYAEHGLETGDMKHDGKLNYIGSRVFKRSSYLTNYLFRTTFEAEEDKSGVYVVLANILVDSEHWEEA
ncbi:hypothetical protein Tco_1417325 [Tanacetum coccineum]